MTPTLGRRRFHLSMTRAPQLRAPGHIRDPRTPSVRLEKNRLHSLNICGPHTTEPREPPCRIFSLRLPKRRSEFRKCVPFRCRNANIEVPHVAAFRRRCPRAQSPSHTCRVLLGSPKSHAKSHLSGASIQNQPNHCQTDLAAAGAVPG